MLSSLRPRASSAMKVYCFDRKFICSSTHLVPLQLPSPKETHIWYVLPKEVKSESLLKEYLELLPPHEKEHVFRMQGDEQRKNALIARALVRTTIARYQINTQVSPRSLKFRKNNHGKPEVDWQQNGHWHQPPLHFNISHTTSLIACGVTMNSPIGIDVEEKTRKIKHNILSFCRRYFSHHEVKFLTSISDLEVQRREFIKLWTLKESYVKALGRGFSGAPFNTFTIQFRSASTGRNLSSFGNSYCEGIEIVLELLDDHAKLTSNWQFALLELAHSHYAAICTEKDRKTEGKVNVPMELIVWKTIPLVEDNCVSGTDEVVTIGGLT